MNLLKKIQYHTLEYLTEPVGIKKTRRGEIEVNYKPVKNPYYQIQIFRGRSNNSILTKRYSPSEWKLFKSRIDQGEVIYFGNPLDRDGIDKSFLYLFHDSAYESELYLPLEDVKLIIEQGIKSKKENLKKELERVKAIAESEGGSRAPIPEDVQILVWKRDGGKCVTCGSNRDLEFDHIIPVSRGGSNTARNIQLLCEKCNRTKGSKIGG